MKVLDSNLIISFSEKEKERYKFTNMFYNKIYGKNKRAINFIHKEIL